VNKIAACDQVTICFSAQLLN